MYFRNPRLKRFTATFIFIAVALLLPWIFQNTLSLRAYPNAIHIATLAAYYSICAIGLNIIVGYCGLLNLGFAGFMLIGSYTTAILTLNYSWPFWLALVASGFHAALWGVILGLPTLRLTGDYFAIVTFGFGELVNLVARNWIAVTRGPSGIHGIPRPSINLTWLHDIGLFKGSSLKFTFDISKQYSMYYWYLAAGLLGLALLMTSRLSRSRLGRAWRALREDEVAAEACGINAAWYKTLAFAISAAVGGVAGAFLAGFSTRALFYDFEFKDSISVLAYVVLGGMGTVSGPALGAVCLFTLGELLRKSPADYIAPFFGWWPAVAKWLDELPWASEMRMIIYGVILILVIRFRPEGLLPSRSRSRELHNSTSQDDIDNSLYNLRTAE